MLDGSGKSDERALVLIDLLAGCHGGTGLWVTDWETSIAVVFLDNLKHAVKKTILFDDCCDCQQGCACGIDTSLYSVEHYSN